MVELPDDLAGLDIERREERGRAVPDVIMGPPLDLPGPQRQQGLCAIEGLDLRIFVYAEDQDFVGRIQ